MQEREGKKFATVLIIILLHEREGNKVATVLIIILLQEREGKKFATVFNYDYVAGEGRGNLQRFLIMILLQEREGEICNACVLLVKRWRKLPEGSTRNWAHVVDAR